MGLVFSPAFWAFTMAIFVSGSLIDVVGMRRLHVLSAIGFIAGVALIGMAPRPDAPVASLFDHPGTMMLYAGFFMFGVSHGLVEGVINPLMASLYTGEKTRRITSVHAWWPAGLVIGGLLAVGMTRAGIPWEAKLGAGLRAGCRLPRHRAVAALPGDRAGGLERVDGRDVGAGGPAALPGADGLHVDDRGDGDGTRSVVPDGDGRSGAAAQSRRRQRRAVPGLHRRA